MRKPLTRNPKPQAARPGPPPQGNLLLIRKSLDGKRKRPLSFAFDLGEHELSTIGLVMVQWAFMEEALYRRTVYFARRARVKIPSDASDLSFARRLRVLRLLVGSVLKDAKKLKWWNDLISEIAGANGNRQKVAHGLWTFDARNPARLYSRPRPILGKLLTPFNVEKLAEFGLQLGEISFALTHPHRTQQWPQYMDGRAASVSRRFLLMMRGEGESLGFPPPIPATQAPPLTPSQALLLAKLKTIGR